MKATYALDAASVKALERMARRWAVSKSEALRRAINAAAASDDASPKQKIEQFERLQAEIALTPAKARAWECDVRAERRAARAPRGARKRA